MSSFQSPRTPNRGVVNRRPQTDHISGGVERPDHHCGDDLVTVKFVTGWLMFDVTIKVEEQN